MGKYSQNSAQRQLGGSANACVMRVQSVRAKTHPQTPSAREGALTRHTPQRSESLTMRKSPSPCGRDLGRGCEPRARKVGKTYPKGKPRPKSATAASPTPAKNFSRKTKFYFNKKGVSDEKAHHSTIVQRFLRYRVAYPSIRRTSAKH